MKSLLIRADAGGRLGAGHVMRMIALAQAWMEHEGSVTMATIECPGKLVERILAEGISHVRLDSSEIGTESDSEKTRELAEELKCGWIVLDGYRFDYAYQQAIHRTGRKLLVMDDFIYSPRWCADLIVNQNPACNPVLYINEKASAKVFCGTDYVLLRKEFWAVKRPEVLENGMRRMVISMGGIDADNLTGAVIETLDQTIDDILELRVVVGAGNPHTAGLKRTFQASKHNIRCLSDVRNMSELYSWADSVITAAGGTVWEWLRFGHRGGFVIAAENQEGLAEWLSKTDLGVQLGFCKEGHVRLDRMALGTWHRRKASYSCSDSPCPVDGRGGLRIVEHMASF